MQDGDTIKPMCTQSIIVQETGSLQVLPSLEFQLSGRETSRVLGQSDKFNRLDALTGEFIHVLAFLDLFGVEGLLLPLVGRFENAERGGDESGLVRNGPTLFQPLEIDLFKVHKDDVSAASGNSVQNKLDKPLSQLLNVLIKCPIGLPSWLRAAVAEDEDNFRDRYRNNVVIIPQSLVKMIGQLDVCDVENKL